ncbi:PREDICTED: E3 UFM1-protein ligase 1 [Propithecus coquereli]|uniref:E3 UFM1-protein ligase 1 n=1 Tax=Propithecus coquereli TaxID=379532 RepID=UPI00063EDBF7|nr:PREDICTED: E3 UFM1-protein ligase 1 [Propithecus coquereli]
MADAWEEIRRLAADFQRAQFAEATQRLSERNCIEIVNKLIAQKQLEVVHTLDGKEYITPAQISKEMRDELHVRGGRVNIVDLQQVINVDLTHIENRIGDIVKSEKHVQLVLGQLIDENYLDRLAEEVNDKLQESGQVTISELCKTYDLPGNFLTQALTQRLGRIISGHIDLDNRGVIFTEAFVARHKARIRGLFSAITRSVLEELVNSGRLRGTVVGGRQDKAVFVPDIYSRTQSTWVDSFFRQNGYLEFDSLSRLGIPDAVSYIKKRFKTTQLLFLKAACVGQGLVDQVEASVEEAISSGTWVDIAPLLPSSLSVEDAAILLQQVMRAFSKQASAVVFSDTIVVSEKFINDCTELFNELMHQKAEKVRKKILSKLSEETKVALTKLHNSLNEKSIEDFLSCLDSAAEACDIMVKRGDKKRERQILFQHRQALAEQLKVTEDPALILHLTSVLLFQFTTHSMLHAPGRCVPQIIAFLNTKIPEDQHTLLVKYQGLVVKQLVSQNKKTGQGGDPLSDELDKEQENVTNTTRKELQELSSSIKDLVLKSRKSSMTEE